MTGAAGRRAALAAFLALAAAGARPGAAEDEAGGPAEVYREPSDPKLNYRLVAKPTWTFKPPSEALKKEGVQEVGERVLDLLADRKTPGEGRGGRVVLAVSDPPGDFPAGYEDAVYRWQMAEEKLRQLENAVPGEAVDAQRAAAQKESDDARAVYEKDLAALAAREDVQRLLLQRFDPDPKRWPAAEVDAEKIVVAGATRNDPEVPAATVEVAGGAEAGNLLGTPMPCKAKMIVAVVRGKLYRLAIWVWTTPRDREGLWRGDAAFLESSFVIPKSAAMPSKAAVGAAPAPGAAPEAAGPGDEAEERPVENLLIEGWKAVKPAGLRTVPPDPSKPDRRYSLHLESPNKQLIVTLEVKRSDERDAAGNVAGEMDVRGYFTRMWPQFLSFHGQGPLESFDWPRSPREFLALPSFEKPNPIKRPPPGQKKDWDWAELEKLKIVSETDNVQIGKHKVRNTYRMGMRGIREKVGPDLQLYWAFHQGVRTYLLSVIAYQQGTLEAHKAPLETLLKSFVLDPPEK